MNKILFIIALLLLPTSMIFAASQGTVGSTSTGSSNITLTVADRVRISSVADISLGTYSGTGDMVGTSEFCVYRNGGTNYTSTITTTTGSLNLTSAFAGDSVVFTLRLDDDTDASNGESIAVNGTSSNLVGSSSVTCSGADNASIEITLLEAALQGAITASDYNNTVTLLVSPT